MVSLPDSSGSDGAPRLFQEWLFEMEIGFQGRNEAPLFLDPFMPGQEAVVYARAGGCGLCQDRRLRLLCVNVEMN